eukprot:TRINITY_DN10855_c0_g1_i1.p1 TRINITY_DN10855_c0_g1~~TRINITY_DN10855_c0_g1_i1.p1  ORF type:complete len:395 (+),score=65.96 TRINITY_DN10855_c0_g1_i1:150-1334(+)
MAMANTFLISPNISPLTSTNPNKNTITFHSPFLFSSHSSKLKRPHFSLLTLAAISPSHINVDYMQREFSGHGASFAGIGDSCVVKLGLDNGTVATLMLPSGLITSYKPFMWHGGTVEVLHTSVSEGADNGGVAVQGGVSVGFNFESDGGVSWSPSTWALHAVRGSSEESIQVELICSDSEAMVEVKYLVTLQEDNLTSELIISNLKSSSLQLMGSIISHLTVSTPDATYAVGLQGSNYVSKPPLVSDFSIIPPGFIQKRPSSVSNQSWGQVARLFSSWGSEAQKDDESKSEVGKPEYEIECEEEDNYAQLTEKMSRIYTFAPRKFTLIDRGRRNSVIVGRIGFDELYVFSPGSNNEWYGKYAYISTGPSALLKPVVLGPQAEWRGAQYLHNPNR